MVVGDTVRWCCVLTLGVVWKRSASCSTTQSWTFLSPEVSNGFSAMSGIWVPMVMTKKVCQRLADQVSSLRWGLICPNQLIGLKKRIHLVATMHCCVNCSARHDPGNISLRSRKVCQWLRICWVTLFFEGMTTTSGLEAELSSNTKESSKRRLNWGSERWP